MLPLGKSRIAECAFKPRDSDATSAPSSPVNPGILGHIRGGTLGQGEACKAIYVTGCGRRLALLYALTTSAILSNIWRLRHATSITFQRAPGRQRQSG